MSYAMTLGMFDWIGDFFKALFNLIPKTIYLLYASLACLLDILQLFFRKLAGLDVYYVDGVAQSGDLVTNFIGGILGINFNTVKNTHPYPMLTNVFWAMIVFGIIICFASMLIAIVKAHYSYDGKTTPKQIVMTGGKAIINMFAVPIIVLLGLFVSQALLTALDSITSVSSGLVEASFGSNISKFKSTDTVQSATGKSNEKTYLYYDIFGFGGAIPYGDVSGTAQAWTSDEIKNLALIGAKNQTFSGSLFRVAAYNANRVRLGQYSKTGSDFAGREELFGNAKDDVALADLVDMAFCNNMHLQDSMVLHNFTRWDSKKYFTNFTVSWVQNFSKFNVGAVWYYYDLWQFNFIVGFAGCIVCSTIFINIIFGLMTRLIMCLVLFLIAPPLFGLAPIKDAAKGWRDNFMKQALMAYGAVVGMNLVMMILPYLNEIDFFNIPIVDYLAQTLFIIVGLISIKAVIATVSELVGGADANKTGGDIAEDVGKTTMKAGKMTLGAAKVGMKVQGAAFKGMAAAGNTMVAGHDRLRQNVAQGKANRLKDASAKVGAIDNASDSQLESISRNIQMGGNRDEMIQDLIDGKGGSKMERNDAERLYDSVKNANGGAGLGKLGGKSGADLRESIRNKTINDSKLGRKDRKSAEKGNFAALNSRATKFENKAAVKGKAADARLHRAKENLFAKEETDENGKVTKKGGVFNLMGQAGRLAGEQMASNYKEVYTGNKFGGVFKDEAKKASDKVKEKEAQKAEKDYRTNVTEALAQINANTKKDDGDK